LTYKTKYDVVFLQENPDDQEVDRVINWYARYLDCLPLIENKTLRSYAEEHGGHKIYYELPARIIYAKGKHNPNLNKSIILSFIKSMYQLRGWGKGFLYQIIILICYITPTKLCEYYIKKRE
jgi:hypothetical protein